MVFLVWILQINNWQLFLSFSSFEDGSLPGIVQLEYHQNSFMNSLISVDFVIFYFEVSNQTYCKK